MAKTQSIGVTMNKSTRADAKTWSSLPPQKVSQSVKDTDDWQHGSVDSIIGQAQQNGNGGSNGRSTRENKVINYDIVNSRFRQENFDHVLNPYGVTNSAFTSSQTKMQNYNIIRQEIESLKGEEMKMNLNFRNVALNGEAVNQKNIERAQAVKDAIKQRAMAIMSGQLNEAGQPDAPDPAEVANSYRTEYANPIEIESNKLLKFLIRKDMLQMKFSKGWEHALIAAEELYYMSIKGGHPTVRVCNPLNVEFDRETDSPFVHKGDWAMEERWMTRGNVIDTYGKFMSDDLVKRLDDGELGGVMSARNGMQRDFAYDPEGGMRMDNGLTENTSHVYVAETSWRSYKKIGTLKYLSPRTGLIESTTVDESFKMTPEMKETGATISWEWITEIWGGTRIGHNDYVNIRPLENQTGNLPYVGYIYNNVNSIATSIVDMCKAHQYTYLIVWYRLEQELAKAKGRKFVMDLAQLPKSKGWTVDQWMYYFDNLGVAWVNSMEEGRKGDPNSISKFNQFQGIDMSLSKVVGEYMMILNKLEEQVRTITGVSKQRAGDIGTSETATGAQRAIIQSTNNTKPLFFYHDVTREVVLQELMELSKVAYIDGIELEHALDEKVVESIRISAGMLNGTDLGVFVTNSFEESLNKEKMEKYLDVALQTDKANLSDVTAVLGSWSMSEIRDTIVAGERDKVQRDTKAQQDALVSQEKINAANIQDKQDERVHKEKLKQMENDTKVDVALIGYEGSKGDSSDLDDTERLNKIALENRKQSMSESKVKEDIAIKKEELEEKKRNNKETEKISKTNKTNSNGGN